MSKPLNIIGRRKIWYTISLLIIVPGLISLFTSGLRLGIDFKGGSLVEVEGKVTLAQVRSDGAALGFKDISVIGTNDGRSLIRYRDEATPTQQIANHRDLTDRLAKEGIKEVRFEAVGPSVSKSIAINALLALALASAAIVLYVAYAFRNVPPPVSPWSFGLAAIVALLHDALLLIGIFSILGAVFKIELDSLFVTAVLTVIGFSVHDTIVVFDRIRENLRRDRENFEETVNKSIIETLARSLNTSLTVLLTLLALYLFGGESIKLFVLALLIGIASGTYSSILNAAPLLVTWHNFRNKRAASAKVKAKVKPA